MLEFLGQVDEDKPPGYLKEIADVLWENDVFTEEDMVGLTMGSLDNVPRGGKSAFIYRAIGLAMPNWIVFSRLICLLGQLSDRYVYQFGEKGLPWFNLVKLHLTSGTVDTDVRFQKVETHDLVHQLREQISVVSLCGTLFIRKMLESYRVLYRRALFYTGSSI